MNIIFNDPTIDDWIENRVLHRAIQHNLISEQCKTFDSINDQVRELIFEHLPKGTRIVLVFWHSETLWTVLGTKSVYSWKDGELNQCVLDVIKKGVRLDAPANLEAIQMKTKISLICLTNCDVKIWAPAGKSILALMNILLMFPLSLPTKTA